MFLCAYPVNTCRAWYPNGRGGQWQHGRLAGISRGVQGGQLGHVASDDEDISLDHVCITEIPRYGALIQDVQGGWAKDSGQVIVVAKVEAWVTIRQK